MLLFLIPAGLALVLSFVCSLMEACLLSFPVSGIARIAVDSPRIASIWKHFKDNIHGPISAILILNTIATTMGAAISAAAFDNEFGQKWVYLYSAAFALVMIQWGEILPKTLGYRYNQKLAVWSAKPLHFLVHAFSPLVWIIQFINRPFASRRARTEIDAFNEMSVLARFAAMNKLISDEQVGIISRSMNLSKTLVSDVMVQRQSIRFLSAHMKMVDAFLEAHVHRHTRYLLVEDGNLDKIAGYVNFKDIVGALKVNPRDPTLRGITRPIISVRPEDSLISLLNLLTRNHQHIAIVKATDGTTAGLVTLEDVMEAIVGDIQDEFDVLPAYLNQLSKSSYLAGGGVKMTVLRK